MGPVNQNTPPPPPSANMDQAMAQWWAQVLAARKWPSDKPINDPLDYYNTQEFFKNATPEERQRAISGHMPDTYKLPGHKTFSNQSKYYVPGLENIVPTVEWQDDNPVQLPFDWTWGRDKRRI